MRLSRVLPFLSLAFVDVSAVPLAIAFSPALSRRATTAVKCSSTTTCSAAAYSIPSHAHYACNKARGLCTWCASPSSPPALLFFSSSPTDPRPSPRTACNSGFAVLGDGCAQHCTTSSTCKNEVPANANRYCASGFCSWRASTSCFVVERSRADERLPPARRLQIGLHQHRERVHQGADLDRQLEREQHLVLDQLVDRSADELDLYRFDRLHRRRAELRQPLLRCWYLWMACVHLLVSFDESSADSLSAATGCRTGFVLNGSICVSTTATTTITTVTTSRSSNVQLSTPTTLSPSSTAPTSSSSSTPSPPIATCSLSSQCTNIVPTNANRYCSSGVCTWSVSPARTASRGWG